LFSGLLAGSSPSEVGTWLLVLALEDVEWIDRLVVAIGALASGTLGPGAFATGPDVCDAFADVVDRAANPVRDAAARFVLFENVVECFRLLLLVVLGVSRRG
jgi:hypothetical protein